MVEGGGKVGGGDGGGGVGGGGGGGVGGGGGGDGGGDDWDLGAAPTGDEWIWRPQLDSPPSQLATPLGAPG